MSEKERLVELLLESEPIKERDLDDGWGDNEISDIAEYLLENGVIVPHAKTALSGQIEICKSEAIKEFAEKIKQRERIMKYDLFPEYAVSVKDIDDIVKEMTEADK